MLLVNSLEPPDVVQGMYFRRKAAMYAEELLVHERR